MPYCYDCGTEIDKRKRGQGAQRILCGECREKREDALYEPKLEHVTWEFITEFETAMTAADVSASRACLNAGVPKDWYSGTTRRLHTFGYARSSREKIARITKWIGIVENDSPLRRAGLTSP